MEWLPLPVALAWSEYQNETQPFRRLHRLLDTYEAFFKYLAIIAIQNFYQAKLAIEYPEIDSEIQKRIFLPTLGDWVYILRHVLLSFSGNYDSLFSKELYLFYFQDLGEDSKRQPYLVRGGASDNLINLRNSLAHGATLSEIESEAKRLEHEPYLIELFKHSEFLQSLSLVYVEPKSESMPDESHQLLRLDGLDPQLVEMDTSCALISNHVYSFNKITDTYLDLYPLLIYTMCKESISTIDPSGTRIDSKRPCGIEKVLTFNSRIEEVVSYLDYWRGHHTRFEAPDLLPREFNEKFPGKRMQIDNLLDSQNKVLLNNLTINFIGREQDIIFLKQFIQINQAKVLVIIGDPGIGKTTLLAHMAKEHDYPCHFIREGNEETLEPISMYKNLASQITRKYGLKRIEPKDQDPSSYRRSFIELLSSIPYDELSEERAVIIIDGLDESIKPERPEKASILSWLPDQILLPDKVKMILSTRSQLLENNLFKSRFDNDMAMHKYLDKLGVDAVRELLYQVQSKYTVIDNPKYVEAIVEVSEGNPLYLKMLLKGISDNNVSFGDISGLPKGIVAFFERILEKIEYESLNQKNVNLRNSRSQIIEKEIRDLYKKDSNSVSPEVLKVLDRRSIGDLQKSLKDISLSLLILFCLAHQPLDIRTASSILGIDDEAENAYRKIQTVLSKNEMNEFSVFHSRFREYVLNLQCYTDTKINRLEKKIQDTQMKIIEWCQKWRIHKNPYALRFYVNHLLENNRIDELYDLANNTDFLKAQDQLSLTLSLRTIRLAMDAAIGANNAGLIVEFSFKFAEKIMDVIHSKSCFEVLRSGNVEEARQIAKLYEPQYRSLFYLLIALELINTNQEQEAINTLKEMVISGKRITTMNGWQFDFVEELLKRLIDYGNSDIWMQLGHLIDPNQSLIILVLIRQQMFQEAGFFINKMTDPVEKDKTKGILAIHLVRADNDKEAQEIISSIEDQVLRADILKKVNETKIIEDAIEEKISDFPSVFDTYNEIAKEWAVQGNYEAAIRTVQNYLYYFTDLQIVSTLENISRNFIQSFDVESAINCAQSVEDEKWRQKIFAGIALAQSSSGTLVDTLQIYANYFLNPEGRDLIYLHADDKYVHRIVQRYPEWEGLLYDSFEGLGELLLQVKPFLLVEDGDLIGGLYNLVDVFEIPEGTTEYDEDFMFGTALYYLGSLVESYVKSHNLLPHKDGILQFFKKNQWSRRVLIPQLAKELAAQKEYQALEVFLSELSISDFLDIIDIAAALGDYQYVTTAIDLIKSQKKYHNELEHLVKTLAKIKDYASALEIAAEPREIKDRALLFLAIERIMFENGDFHLAASTLAMTMGGIELKNTRSQSDTGLSILALEYSRIGKFAEALDIASFIRNEDKKNNALKNIAVDQANRGDIESSLETYSKISPYSQRSIVIQKICSFLCQKKNYEDALEIAHNYFDNRAVFNTLLQVGIEHLKNADLNLCLEDIFNAFQSRAADSFDQGIEVEVKEDLEDLVVNLTKNNLEFYKKDILFSLAVKTDEQIKEVIYNRIDYQDYYKAEILKEIGRILLEEGYKNESHQVLLRTIKYLDGDSPYVSRTHLIPLAELFLTTGDIFSVLVCYSKLKVHLDNNSDSNYVHLGKYSFDAFTKELQNIGINPQEPQSIKLSNDEIAELWRDRDVEEYFAPEISYQFMNGEQDDIDFKSLLFQISRWYSGPVNEDESFFDRPLEMDRIIDYWADHKQYVFAFQLTNLIGHDYRRSYSLCNIAKSQIKAEKLDDAFETSRLINDSRGEFLPQIAEAFLDAGAFDYFKLFVGECITEPELIFTICALFARIYPDQIDDISFQLLEKLEET